MSRHTAGLYPIHAGMQLNRTGQGERQVTVQDWGERRENKTDGNIGLVKTQIFLPVLY